MIKLLIVEDSEETVDLIKLILSNETDIKILDASTIKDGMNLVKKIFLTLFYLTYLYLMEMELIYVNKLGNFQNFMGNHLL